ncbi:hypothetical protein GPECTOR_55g308 [Gonium pectorale]|uniref:Glycosyl transferase CAP10 domain-containing protein n=1 Tax=Gonium pectorale TaxID=33097 RepID=A0A150G6D0_GONPE|nr:hypothetical protein GPECTOR_55g308 [Gonium pectorale]|eukprot:KXZ45402.1 hypothetical protein GPECTOR_55g308 [Gonium pectorale]
MDEGRHMITVNEDWSDLEEVYRKLEADPVLAESIAAENARMMQLLSEDSISCYILESLKCFKDVAQYEVEHPTLHATLDYFVLSRMKPSPHLTGLALNG